ncbi:MAG: L-ribulose-5-phosphate 3-epimerase [Chlamydiales bacterium]
MFTIGYNTNGLAHHRLLDALRLLSDLGYEGVAITPDVGVLDPLQLDRGLMADTRSWAQDLGLALSIETGARFVLDARRKHYPTLLEDDPQARARRVDFLKRSIDMAAALEAPLVSLWSGAAPDGCVADDPDSPGAEDARAIGWERLCHGLTQVLEHGRECGVQIAFEPEPGMFIERPGGYGELLERLGPAGDALGLCLDVGHLLVTGDLPVERVIHAWAPRLVHVHLDDIADGIHEHCMFGSGDLDLTATLSALIEVGYDGMAAVELSRDSHRGAAAAGEAMDRIRAALGGSGPDGAGLSAS